LKALDNIDEVIMIIRSSADALSAREKLIARFLLSEEQAGAIVEMRLRSLTGLERDRLSQEYNELVETIKDLTAVLGNEKLLFKVIREELLIIKTKYGDGRRTLILHDPGEIVMEDLIDEENSVITLSRLGYVKRIPSVPIKTKTAAARA